MSYFDILNKINVNEHTEKKNGLTYLSWAWAWGELKKRYPLSFYTVYEDARGCCYFTDGQTCWVKTGVTVVDGEKQLEHIEYLPVMNYKNKSLPAESVTSFDVNKAIQRSLTKAVARHGLGLYIYAGEDLPEEERPEPTPCADCGNGIKAAKKRDGSPWPAAEIIDYSTNRFGRPLCPACQRRAFEKEKEHGA